MLKGGRKIRIFIAVIICASAFAAVIALRLKATDDEKNKAGTVDICYTNLDGTELVYEEAVLKSNSPQEMAKEVIEEMNTHKASDSVVVIKPKDVVVESVNYENGVVTVDFDRGYYDIEPATEALYRAALIETVCQLKGVEALNIYSEGRAVVLKDGIQLEGLSPASVGE